MLFNIKAKIIIELAQKFSTIAFARRVYGAENDGEVYAGC